MDRYYQNIALFSDKYKKEKEYWDTVLSQNFEMGGLIPDAGIISEVIYQKEEMQFCISGSLYKSLHTVSGGSYYSIYAILLSAVSYLIYKYTSNDELIIGIPPIRQKDGLKPVNILLPLRAKVEEVSCYKDFVKNIGQAVGQAIKHQNIPFEAGINGKNGLDYKTAVILENIHALEAFTNITLDILAGFHVMEDKLKGWIKYNKLLFTKETIELFADYVIRFITVVINNSDIILSDINILSTEKINMQLFDLNNTAAGYPKDKTIHQMFEEQAEKNPQKTALVYGDKRLTYGALNEKANQLARILRKRGIKEDCIVGILAEKSFDLIIGIIGTLKAGGAYMPIDPEYPSDRIRYMMEDSGARALLTIPPLIDKADYDGEIIKLDDECTDIEDKGNLVLINNPRSLAYVIYTSGTTGKPKGAMIEHRNVVRLITNDKILFDFGEKDIWTMFHSCCFDFSVWEMYGALLCGGELILIPKHISQNTQEYLNLLIEKKVTILNQTPSAFYRLLEQMENDGRELSVRNIIFGGEALKPSMLKKFRQKHPDIKLINMYGITETTVHVTYKEITEDEIDKTLSNIGRPIPTQTVYIMDRNMRLLPLGAAGELCVGGEGVGRGYLNGEELTREKFVQNPYIKEEILYRSGDLGRLLTSGDIEYLGRIDYQIKIRGHRVEPGEIEDRLIKHEAVKAAVVIALEDEDTNNYLCAYIVSDKELTIVELRKHLLKDLPDYMIPSHFVRLKEIPLNSNGKLDKKKLPKPNSNIKIGTEYEAYGNDIEKNLTEIWMEVLGAERIGIKDNFFALGGDSIKALRVLGMISTLYNKKISIKNIYECGTIKELAILLEDMEIDDAMCRKLDTAAKEIEKIKHKVLEGAKSINFALEDIEDLYPMSDIEQGMIFYYLKNLKDAVYHDQLIYMFRDKELEIEALKKSIELMTQKHPILRTTFDIENFEQAIQFVKLKHIPEIKVLNIESMNEDEQETYIRNCLKEDRKRIFDFSNPLWRIKLFVKNKESIVFVLICHHAILDGWSVASFITELSNIYYQIKNSKDVELKADNLLHSYKDFVIEQMVLKLQPEIKDYWKKELYQYKRLKLMWNNWSKGSGQIKENIYRINHELLKKVKELADYYKSDVKSIYLLVYAYMLNMLTYENDVLVGLVEHNRPICEDSDKILGCFLNTVPFRLKIKENMSWEDLIIHVNSKAAELKLYGKLPLFEIVKCIGENSNYENPLFDMIFNYVDFHILNNVHEDLKNSKISFVNDMSYAKTNTLMNFTFYNTYGDANACIVYDTGIFTPYDIDRLFNYFNRIIKLIITDPKRIINKNEVLPQEEKEKLLLGFNNNICKYDNYRTIHEIFEERVKQNLGKKSVVFEDKALTYEELNAKANQLARIIRDNGIVKEQIVAIIAEPSSEMLIAIIAILKAGGAYLPIDPEYPKDRIEHILQDSRAKLVLSQYELQEDIIHGKKAIVFDKDLIYQEDCNNLEPLSKSTDSAYIIYTSGTTGKSKGVMVENKSLVNYVNWFANIAEITSDDKSMLLSSFAFDLGYTALYSSILSGAELHIVSRNTYTNPEQLISYINSKGITYIKLTPSLYNAICNSKSFQEGKLKDTLRLIVLGGEPINTEDVEKTYKLYSKIQIMNHYGPTETTVGTTGFIIDRDKLESFKKNPVIGKPINNNRAYILDNFQRLVPIGISGELCIAGEGLARGYLMKPELTAEKFISNPFEQGARLYRTGDIARWMPDGNIEYLGRIDSQVKIRGYRVELGEIEAVLLRHPSIKEAAVIDRLYSDKDRYLCAYITEAEHIEIAEIRNYLRKSLPEYMIPAFFVILDKLPLNQNGKVDKEVLPKPESNLAAMAEYEAPENEIEERLTVIWKQVLNRERVSTNESFFDIGGHSLMAISLTVRIQNEFLVDFSLSEIFKNPTIKGLAQHIAGLKHNSCVQIPQADKAEYYEASSAQKRIYILQQLDQSSTTYNMPSIMELEGFINKSMVMEAFEVLIKRHEILRTSFVIAESGLKQVIHENVDFSLEYEEGTDICLEERLKEFIKPFDLSKAPALRASLTSITPNKHILMYDLHHIASDGVSRRMVVRELMELLDGKELQPLKIQYKDYAVWQNQYIKSDKMKEQKKYWLERFTGELPVLNMPCDYLRPQQQSFDGDEISLVLDKDNTKRLKDISKHEGATLYMVLLAVFNVTLSKYSRQNDIIVGTPIIGRNHADLLNVMGMFVNTLAMRNYLDDNKSFTEFLHSVKDNALRAYEAQDYQFEELIDNLKIIRDARRNPLFDVMFSMVNLEQAELISDKIKLKPIQVNNKISKFDMTLTAVEIFNGDSNQENIFLNLEYCTSLYKKETIKRFLQHFIKVISDICENPDKKLKDINMLTEEEENEILLKFNNTKSPYNDNIAIHQIFEQKASKAENKTALIFGDYSITYGQLNDRASQLARTLVKEGIGIENVVGIMAERSIEMIVGILAILKAGGAYLPLDPKYPNDRIEYMLEDSKCKLVLIQSQFKDKLKADRSIVVIDDEMSYQSEKTNLSVQCRTDNLIYIIYTSGSTGDPKGVMIEHRNVINILTCMQNKYPVYENDAYLLKTSYTFDISVAEIFGWFMGNGKLVILEHGGEKDPKIIKNAIIKHKITHINFVPSMLNTFVNLLEQEEKQQLRSLKYIFSCGEALSRDLAVKVCKDIENVRLENIYGPTEAAIYTTDYPVTQSYASANVLIGKPMHNINVYITDKNNRLMPIGIPGELCISGAGVARGYLNKAELTQQKFIECPFISSQDTIGAAKMYKTGDLARWLPDGNIEFLGRIDSQIKIRGFRIELGEIESTLQAYHGVDAAVVILKDDESGSKYLCAYFVSKEQLEEKELLEYLAQKLPEYMLPAYIIRIDKLPITTSGKIDKSALPEPNKYLINQNHHDKPTNALEEKLSAIWTKILNIDTVGINNTFFEFGGNSLKITIFAYTINKELGIEIPLNKLYSYSTIKKLAEYIIEDKLVKANRQYNNLLLIKKGNNNYNNIFMIHNGSGQITAYNELCNMLHESFNCWGIISNAYDIKDDDYYSIKQIAKEYVKQIKDVQKTGPYCIMGWCIGGTIAFEVLRLLEQYDKEKGFLYLINSVAPSSILRELYSMTDTDGLREHNVNVKEYYKEIIAALRNNELDFDLVKNLIHNKTINAIPENAVNSRQELLNYVNILRILDCARAYYYPSNKLRAYIKFIAATEAPAFNYLEWDKHAENGIDFIEINAEHFTLFKKPYVGKLAQEINKCLAVDNGRYEETNNILSHKIGSEFMKRTKYVYLHKSDQEKGMPEPKLELEYEENTIKISLPDVKNISIKSLELRTAIESRASVRRYSADSLSMEELSYLLWCTQGVKQIVNGVKTFRTVPSAGGRHAFETYLLINNVEGIKVGLYRYLALEHKLIQICSGSEISEKITLSCFNQEFISKSAVTFIWSAVSYRMTWKYGERGFRYLHLDAGHICQSLYMAAESIDTGVCAIASFDDDKINNLLDLDGENQFVVYLAAVGKK